ncbi:MAG: UMP kinase [Candidatus Brocadiae bacterium]|nr:UMP kinase [Candidatus Brocadiia bacterium]
MKYKKILLKISGESFGNGLSSFESATNIVKEIAQLHKQEVQIGLVIGAGNIVRGSYLEKQGIARVAGDDMGMLATVINSILLQELLQKEDVPSIVLTPKMIEGIGEVYNHRKCLEYLKKNIIIFSGGTGHPYFTTDTASALRAVEMQAECFFKATKVDGVYDDDPIKNPKAHKFDFLTYQDILSRQYRVMDLTAISFCMENSLPVCVFDLMTYGNLTRAIKGENPGTWIANSKP